MVSGPNHTLGTIGLILMAWSTTVVRADEVTRERINQLPTSEQAAWIAYLDISQAMSRLDTEALAKEVAEIGSKQATRAPDGDDFRLPSKPAESWYASDEAQSLVDAILSYQTPSGGWSKHIDYRQGPRKKGMQWTSQSEPGKRPHYQATFDNRSTTEQLHLLLRSWRATGREDCKDAYRRGIAFVLRAQYPNGGWPQVYPLEGDYHDDITLNDDALTHILELLLELKQLPDSAAGMDDLRRAADASLQRAIGFIVHAQVRQDGKSTAWCAQHDPLTLLPSHARKLEPPSLSGSESSRLLEVLMKIPSPSPALIQSIEAGLAWLERVKIEGLARVKRDGKTQYVEDTNSKEIFWARFYDLRTSTPIFPGRDGVVYPTYAEMAAKNKLGYDYYTTHAGSVLKNGQKKWRASLQ